MLKVRHSDLISLDSTFWVLSLWGGGSNEGEKQFYLSHCLIGRFQRRREKILREETSSPMHLFANAVFIPKCFAFLFPTWSTYIEELYDRNGFIYFSFEQTSNHTVICQCYLLVLLSLAKTSLLLISPFLALWGNFFRYSVIWGPVNLARGPRGNSPESLGKKEIIHVQILI